MVRIGAAGERELAGRSELWPPGPILRDLSGRRPARSRSRWWPNTSRCPLTYLSSRRLPGMLPMGTISGAENVLLLVTPMDPSIHLSNAGSAAASASPALRMLAVITVLGASLFGMFAFLESNAAFGTVQDVTNNLFCNPNDYDLSFPDPGEPLRPCIPATGCCLGKITERNSQPVSIDEIPDVVQGRRGLGRGRQLLSARRHRLHLDSERRHRQRHLGPRPGVARRSPSRSIKKNILRDEITLDRKICEAVIAAELERRYTKDQILEYYLNSQFFGYNAYGVTAAAQEYFGKSLDELSIAEAAAISVPIRNPPLYDMRDPTKVEACSTAVTR